MFQAQVFVLTLSLGTTRMRGYIVAKIQSLSDLQAK